jgi:catechol 2,3-dioxygenase-like lactoylglutathione lyase family enzyme
MIGALDHVALGVRDLEERLAFLTGTLGMTIKRRGTHFKSGRPIVLVADSNGFKLELIEVDADEPAFMHLAYRTDDVAADYNQLIERGCEGIRGPHELEAARAETAIVRDSSRLQVQIIKYQPDSPDL